MLQRANHIRVSAIAEINRRINNNSLFDNHRYLKEYSEEFYKLQHELLNKIPKLFIIVPRVKHGMFAGKPPRDWRQFENLLTDLSGYLKDKKLFMQTDCHSSSLLPLLQRCVDRSGQHLGKHHQVSKMLRKLIGLLNQTKAALKPVTSKHFNAANFTYSKVPSLTNLALSRV